MGATAENTLGCRTPKRPSRDHRALIFMDVLRQRLQVSLQAPAHQPSTASLRKGVVVILSSVQEPDRSLAQKWPKSRCKLGVTVPPNFKTNSNSGGE